MQPQSDESETLLRLNKPRIVFFPGHRIKMNIVPMCLNVFLPWAVFVLCCGLTGFYMMYEDKQIVFIWLSLIFLIWVGLVVMAVRQRTESSEPTWWSYAALAFGLAAASGVGSGRSIFATLTRPYFDVKGLKVVPNLDAGKERGQNLMDAGLAYFAHGNHLDLLRAWHFKQGTLYCVAPIVSNVSGHDGARHTRTFDFWAVGQDCCAVASSDFRCGSWDDPQARSGLRILDKEELPFYRLAVKQAESLYGIVATHPIFFKWTQDPLGEVNDWMLQAFKNYVFLVGLSFVVSLFSIMLATAKFSFLGRSSSIYNMDFYDDPEYKTVGDAPQPGYRTRDYSS